MIAVLGNDGSELCPIAIVLKMSTVVLKLRTGVSMNNDPIQALFGQYRRDLLALLLLRPDESFHTRELERLAGIPVGSLTRELKGLVEGGILVRERLGNQVRYQANRACPIFEELAGLFRKTAGLTYVVRDALASRWKDINMAFVFGSVAKGTARSESDLDVLVVTDLKLKQVVSLLSPLREKLGREINPVVMSAEIVAGGLANNDRFLMRIKEEPKLFIKGTQHDFEKLG